MTNLIDKKAFEYISRITKRLEPYSSESSPKMTGLGKIMDIHLLKEYSISETDPLTGKKVSMYRSLKNGDYGLSEPAYEEFIKTILQLIDEEPFSKYCDADFLSDHAFQWLIKTFNEQRADSALTGYLLQALEAERKHHDFYFRITPLELQEPFSIGGVEIMFFTDEEKMQWRKKYITEKPGSEKEFDEISQTAFEGIFAKVKATGVKSRALEKATRHAELAIDALKCLFVREATVEYFLFFDLQIRFQAPAAGEILSLSREPFEMIQHLRGPSGRVPLGITSAHLSQAEQKGLMLLGKFIAGQFDTELATEINRLITDLAEILSNPDVHRKMVMTIRWLESVIIPATKRGKGEGENRIKSKLILRIIEDENMRELLKLSVRHTYNVRDRFLHNAERLPVNREYLFYMMDFMRIIVLNVIERHNQKMTTMDELQDWINKTKSSE